MFFTSLKNCWIFSCFCLLSITACEQTEQENKAFQLHQLSCQYAPESLHDLLNCSLQQKKQETPNIVIGRLICGGHLPLAVVDILFQDKLQSLHLETVQNQTWPDVIRDMKTGKMSGTFILSPLAMKLIEDGFKGKIVLKADRNGNGFVLSKKVTTIEHLKELKTVLAVPHLFSQHHLLLHKLLKQNKIPAENIAIIGMPPRDMINSLERGEIDGFLVGEPEGQRSISLSVGWMAAISPDIWENHIDHVFLVTDTFIQNQPEQLQELIDNLVLAGQYIENNPVEASVMGVNYTGAPAEVFLKVLTSPPNWIDYNDMIPTLSEIQMISEELVDMGLWEAAPADLNKFIDTRFVIKATRKLNK